MYSGNNIISAIQSCAAYEHRERVSLNLTRETRANRSTLRVSSFPLYIYIYQLTTIYSMEKQLEDESRIRREEESVGIVRSPRQIHDRSRWWKPRDPSSSPVGKRAFGVARPVKYSWQSREPQQRPQLYSKTNLPTSWVAVAFPKQWVTLASS